MTGGETFTYIRTEFMVSSAKERSDANLLMRLAYTLRPPSRAMGGQMMELAGNLAEKRWGIRWSVAARGSRLRHRDGVESRKVNEMIKDGKIPRLIG